MLTNTSTAAYLPLVNRLMIVSLMMLMFNDILTASIGDEPADLIRPWPRHTIDDSSKGADGVRLADFDGDGRPEIVTGWEEGGVVRIYRHPRADDCRKRWPFITAGRVNSPEDAVAVDLDSDGFADVISCCEGQTKSVFVHWSPNDGIRRWKSAEWETDSFASLHGRQWMYAVPADINGDGAVDLVLGGKNTGAEVGWLQAPLKSSERRQLPKWKWHALITVGWVMSIEAADLDDDGDLDLLISDRRGPTRGIFWLQNPGLNDIGNIGWQRHEIGGSGYEVMFLTHTDLDGDGRADIAAALREDRSILWFRRNESRSMPSWTSQRLDLHDALNDVNTGTLKAVAAGDLDGDGRRELVVSCEDAAPPRSGLIALSFGKLAGAAPFTVLDISGTEGIKYDRIELLDVDQDGDIDIVTCEERANLGVFWYENPRLPTTR